MYEVNYRITRGEVFDKLIIPKDRRTRRRRVPTEAIATVLIGDTKYIIPTTVTYEGAVRLYMDPEHTEWLPDGVFPWDLAIVYSRSAYFTSSQLAQTIAVRGTLTVTTYDNISPLYVDGVVEPLEELLP